MKDTIKQTLQSLKNHFGDSIFNDSKRFKAALADTPIEADAIVIRNLLNIAICDMKAYSRLESAFANKNHFMVDNLATQMSSDWGIERATTQLVMECIAEFFGYQSIHKMVPAQSTSMISSAPIVPQLPASADEKKQLTNEKEQLRIKLNKIGWTFASCVILAVCIFAIIWPKSSKVSLESGTKIPPVASEGKAKTIPQVTPESGTKIPPVASESKAKTIPQTGSIITFGGYDWRVLEVQDGKALILSEKVIEKRAYHEKQEGITWETCALRSYLNGEFYNKFSSNDKSRIADTRITTNDNPWYGTKGGGGTTDKIFLLSIEEVIKYFGDSGDLKSRKGWYVGDNKLVLKDGKGYTIHDQYNSARIAKDTSGSTCWWWLRSPGNYSFFAAYVYFDGSVSVSGIHVGRDGGGVRSALWLNL